MTRRQQIFRVPSQSEVNLNDVPQFIPSPWLSTQVRFMMGVGRNGCGRTVNVLYCLGPAFSRQHQLEACKANMISRGRPYILELHFTQKHFLGAPDGAPSFIVVFANSTETSV